MSEQTCGVSVQAGPYVTFTQSGDHAAQGDQGLVDAGTLLQPCA